MKWGTAQLVGRAEAKGLSDAVLRHLVIKRDEAITEPSLMAKAREEEEAREAQASTRPPSASREGRPRPSEPAAGDGDDDGPPERAERTDWDANADRRERN